MGVHEPDPAPPPPDKVLRSAPINRKQANKNENAVAVKGSRRLGKAQGAPASCGSAECQPGSSPWPATT